MIFNPQKFCKLLRYILMCKLMFEVRLTIKVLRLNVAGSLRFTCLQYEHISWKVLSFIDFDYVSASQGLPSDVFEAFFC